MILGWILIRLKGVVVRGSIHLAVEFKRRVEIVKIFESTQTAIKLESNVVQSSITVLGDYKFCLTFGWRSFVIIPFVNFIILWAIDERNYIGVLLNCSRLSKVRQNRSFTSCSGLNCTRQLGERYHWNIEFFG